MKRNLSIRPILAITLALLAPLFPAKAATYTWSTNNVYSANTTLDWFTGGPNTQGTWTNGLIPVSDNTATIQFYQNITTAFTNTTAITRTVNLNNSGSAFELGTLTFNGLGSATANANLTNNLTGDALNFSAANGTINLIANRTTIIYNLNNNIQLGTAGSASALTITGNGTGTFNINGNISELQTGGGSLIKSGTSTVTLSGNNTFSGSVTVNGGILTLSGANSYTGSTFINGGQVRINADAALGNTSGGITFTNTAALLTTANNVSLAATRTITVNSGAIAILGDINLNSNPLTVTIGSKITGSGGIQVGHYSLGTGVMNLTNTANNFTGSLTIGTSAAYTFDYSTETLNIASLADGVSYGNIIFGRGAASSANTAIFAWSPNAIAPLVLNNRQIQLDGTVEGAALKNNNVSAANTITVNTDLLVSRAGNKTFILGGTNTGVNVFAGKISNSTSPASVISLSKADAGTWALSGTNTYTGATTLGTGGTGTLIFQGIQAVSPNTAITQNQLSSGGSQLRFLDSSAGNNNTASSTVTLTLNTVNGTGIANQQNTIFVGNNSTANGGSIFGDTTTGETISVGKLTMVNNSSGGGSDVIGWNTIQGANGYRLLINSVDLPTTTGVTQPNVAAYFVPTTATVTLAGTIRQPTSSTAQMTLQLDGTSTGNLVTGNIQDSGDVIPKALKVTKSNTSEWTLSGTNTYTGTTTINGGTLTITSLGNVNGGGSSLGAPTNAANGTIKIGTTTTAATLRYTGTGSTSDRVIDLAGTTGGATLDQSGAGLWKFTSDFTATGAGKKTLTLTNSTAGVGEIGGAVVNASGVNTTSVTKAGTGLWLLSGTNTYTGATAINGGALEAIDGTGLPTTSILQLRGGVFQSRGTFSRTIGTSAGNVGWSTSSGGFAARGGTLNIQLNGGTANVTWNNGSFVDANNALIFGSSTADSLVDFQNQLNLGSSSNGQRTVTVNDNPNSATDIARISGVITNVVAGWGIVKNGTGVLELTGNNKYSGTTTVAVGTMLINNTTGSGTGSGSVIVSNGATLGGSGFINGPVTIANGATISPGNSIGTLTVGNLTLQSGALLNFELGAPGSNDLIIATGTLALGGVDFNQFTWTTVAGFGAGDYTLIDATALSGSLGSVTNTIIGGNGASLWLDTSNNNLMLTVVPEPGSLVLVGAGLGLLMVLRRRRK